MIANSDRQPTKPPPGPRCARCGSDDLDACTQTITLWIGDRPYLVEQIPAFHCPVCAETFIDRQTAERLHRIRAEVSRLAATSGKVEVPVLAFPQVAR